MKHRGNGGVVAWLVLVCTALCGCGAELSDGERPPPDVAAPADLAAPADVVEPADAPDVLAPPPDLLEIVDLAPDALADTAVTAPDAATTAPDAAAATDLVADAIRDIDDVHADAADVPPSRPDIPPPTVLEACFSYFDDEESIGPTYDNLFPVIGTHCDGTDHQDIDGVERVVFLGDSVTVGTPNLAHLLPIENGHFYRSRLGEWLASTFALDRGGILSWEMWKAYDYFSGKGLRQESGAFKNCAKWGARTDDLLDGGGQIPACFPDGGSPYRTLVVFTMGGNDIAAITQDGGNASPENIAAGYPHEWELARSTVRYLEEAVLWLKDPARFPNGSYIVFNNGFEFTDATGRTDSCTPRLGFEIPDTGEYVDFSTFGIDMAGLAGMHSWQQPEVQAEIVIWIMEEYMRIAVEHEVDLVWSLEGFCGHGYIATGSQADVQNQCYLGPDTELWFDISCIHPSPAGHEAMYEMFRAVIDE